MTTNNDVNVGLSGSTGSGNFAGSTSPVFVTPTLGAATATTIAFSPTTGGIIGTTAADNASAGDGGEFISSQITPGSPVSISNNTPKNLTSIVLTAGDWDVYANVTFLQAATTTATIIIAGINTTSATLPDSSLYSILHLTFGTATTQGIVAPYQRINVNTNTTTYIVAQCTFAVSTMTICGGIYARRAR